jgi:hypothetical protein
MRKVLCSILLLVAGFHGMAQRISKADSTQIRNTVLGFYSWYNKSWPKVAAFRLYTGIKSKDNPPYKINWKEADRYFGYIRSSIPQLGEEFINDERKFLKECDSAFKADPGEEMPYGFDYDRFTNSQEEPQWLLDELKKSKQWVMTPGPEEVNVDVLSSFREQAKDVETVVMCFSMKKEKGKWKIGRIGCTFAAPAPNNGQ